MPREAVDGGGVQGQAGWDSEQLGLVGGAHGRKGWTLVIFKVPSSPSYSMLAQVRSACTAQPNAHKISFLRVKLTQFLAQVFSISGFMSNTVTSVSVAMLLVP